MTNLTKPQFPSVATFLQFFIDEVVRNDNPALVGWQTAPTPTVARAPLSEALAIQRGVAQVTRLANSS